ncbi:CrcB-like protein-domain-containing protein [Cladorrhinum sp. PSN259]|nr:CrcB-like protein-domain-containing protein [Cladorrhinum sp. PSN259]
MTSKKQQPSGHAASSDHNGLHDAIPPTEPGISLYPRRASTLPTHSPEERKIRRASTASKPAAAAAAADNYDIPASYSNLDETTEITPVESPDTRLRTLEQARSSCDHEAHSHSYKETRYLVSRLRTQLYTISYLIFFSLLGTLARLGLQALTTYPGTPIIYPSIWPNFAGSLVMGFLAEDRMLFQRYERIAKDDLETGATSEEQAKKAHLSLKKTIPLYIGLATGFCGSFTSFSAFMRDVFLALAGEGYTRNGGYSFLSFLGVVIVTVSMSLAGLFVGAHLAILVEPVTPSLPYAVTRRVLDNAVVVLGWGCWLGAVLMSIFPPNDEWRGVATFALAFAPLGCLARFYLSLKLNGRVASFPLGTFAVNILGTAVLAMSWDLAHVPLGGVVGCQVLQGIQDGFCGCLTTVSTWVAELAALRRGHAYVYGGASVVTGLAVLVAIMGGLRWSDGWEALMCTH